MDRVVRVLAKGQMVLRIFFLENYDVLLQLKSVGGLFVFYGSLFNAKSSLYIY